MKKEKGIIFALLASAAVILLVTVLTLWKRPGGPKRPQPQPSPTAVPTQEAGEQDREVAAMVCSVDTETGTMVLRRLDEKEELVLTYRTAADIRDKYGSLTYAASLQYGDLVRVAYTRSGELISLRRSADHWELRGVEDFAINDTMLSINGVNYRITDRTVFYYGQEELAPGEVKPIDRINVSGCQEEVYTVCVTRGHGSVQLIHTEAYQGAKVTIDGESSVLSGEPSYLVKEGTCRVTVIGEKDAAQAELTIARNEKKVIDLYEYGGKPVEIATVRFHITPFSAVLTVDGEKVDYYEQDLSLAFGEHRISVELGGYRSYQGILTISKAYQSFRIDLVENTTKTPEEGGTREPEEDGTKEPEENETKEPEDSSVRSVDWITDALVETMGFSCDSANETWIVGPQGAEVKIEGIRVGTAPLKFGKLLGTYTITIEKDEVTTEHVVTVLDDGTSVSFDFAR